MNRGKHEETFCQASMGIKHWTSTRRGPEALTLKVDRVAWNVGSNNPESTLGISELQPFEVDHNLDHEHTIYLNRTNSERSNDDGLPLTFSLVQVDVPETVAVPGLHLAACGLVVPIKFCTPPCSPDRPARRTRRTPTAAAATRCTTTASTGSRLAWTPHPGT